MAFKFTSHSKYIKAKIQLIRVVDEGKSIEIIPTGSRGEFFLNPDGIQDVKSSGWVKKRVPGLSDPHQQWVAGEARTVVFKALITNDRSEGHVQGSSPDTGKSTPKNKISFVKRIGAVASQVFNIPDLGTSGSLEAQNRNPSSGPLILSISEKIAFYKSLVYPTAFDSNGAVSPPYLVKLSVGTTFGSASPIRDSIFVVDKVEIDFTRWLPDLTPIEAVVTFTMSEIINKSLTSDIDVMFNY